MKTKTLYRRNENGSVSIWTLHLNGATVGRVWGVKGGAMQTTETVFSQVQNRSPKEVAKAAFDRLLQKRLEAGFKYALDEVREHNKVRTNEFDFTKLPKSFAPQKPLQDRPKPDCTKKRIVHRKRDGQRHYALITPLGTVKLYSSKLNNVTDKFPLTVQAIYDLKLPACTLLDGEIICDRKGKDDFRATNKVCRALTDKAKANEKILPIRYMVFDMLFFGGKPWHSLPYKERWALVCRKVPKEGRVYAADTYLLDDGITRVEKEGWEGLILWDADAPAVLRMDGKFSRHGSNKWKPIKEGDFVAFDWYKGTGANSEVAGGINLAEYRWNPISKKPVAYTICKVGSGFTAADREAVLEWKFPCVVQVEYNLQQPDTRALREPVFIRKRDDKTLKDLRNECMEARKTI